MPKPKNKKILIGFSDIVSIATFVQQNWGWKVICAPMLSQILKNKVSAQSQQIIFDLIGVIVLNLYAAAVIYGGWFDAKNSLMTWEKLGTVWDPPIPAVMKPLILITIFLMAIQSINNLIIDWGKDKQKAYDPVKDLK